MGLEELGIELDSGIIKIDLSNYIYKDISDNPIGYILINTTLNGWYYKMEIIK
jgi:hypothetical protein